MRTLRSSMLTAILLLLACLLDPSGVAAQQRLPPRDDIGFSLPPCLNRDSDSGQILLISSPSRGSQSAEILGLAKRQGAWKPDLGPLRAVVGRNGFAPPGLKQEGDGRTPTGIFSLGTAFGYAPAIRTRMPYRQTREDDLWVDDAESDDYNRWVRRGGSRAASFEAMRRADDLYKYGLVIEYNTRPVVKGRGSAIFLHLWKAEGRPTDGCVAVSERDMLRVLDWLDPESKPLAVMGTRTDLAALAEPSEPKPRVATDTESHPKGGPFPEGFVDIADAIPSVRLDIRYHGPHNFVAEQVDGYRAPRCILTEQAASALAGVQQELEGKGLSLKIYDCYRPQRAVDHFIRWAKDLDDTRTKKEFYPTVDKRDLFRDGYIAERSGHSRGSTVDLTIVPVPTPEQETYAPGQRLFECYLPAGERFRDNGIDMGTGFDCFHESAHTDNPNIGPEPRQNRALLKSLMEKHGFRNFPGEWWHYTLENEPYPDSYFDFEID